LSLFVIAASGGYVWYQGARPATDDALGLTTGSLANAASPDVVTLPAVVVQAPTLAAPPTVGQSDGGPLPPPALPSVAALSPAPPLAPLPMPPAPPVTAALAPASPPEPSQTPDQPPSSDVAMTDVPMPRLRPTPATASAAATSAASTFGTRFSAAFMNIAANTARVPSTASVHYQDGTYTGPAVDAYYGLVRVQAIVRQGRLAAIKVLQYPNDRRTSVYINSQALPMLNDEVISAQSAYVDIISGATLTSDAFLRSLDAALVQAKA